MVIVWVMTALPLLPFPDVAVTTTLYVLVIGAAGVESEPPHPATSMLPANIMSRRRPHQR